jgi:hypothetical protein
MDGYAFRVAALVLAQNNKLAVFVVSGFNRQVFKSLFHFCLSSVVRGSSMGRAKSSNIQTTEWLLYKGVHLWNIETREKVAYKSSAETMNGF